MIISIPYISVLLALSDFAWRSLSSQPALLSWLLCEHEIKNREILDPFAQLDITKIEESECHKLLRQYREKYWLKVAFLDLCCKNPIENSIKYISELANKLIDSANQWAYKNVAKTNVSATLFWSSPVKMQGPY